MTLEVSVESSATGGLRLIEHVPPVRPCRLEGRNGIGKSALIRLLVLASGTQPYAGQSGPWKSLKALVGATTITITGLSGPYRSARLVLTPQVWPKEPDIVVGEWLGTVELDGVVKPARELFEILDVVHVTGTERLQDTLQQQYPVLAGALREVANRLDVLEPQRAELGAVADELASVSPEAATAEALAREAAVERRKAIDGRLEALVPRAKDLQSAVGLRALLDSGDAAEQAQQLETLRSNLAQAKRRLSEATVERDVAVSKLGQGTAAQRQAAKLEQRLSAVARRQNELVERQVELGSRLVTVGIDPDTEDLTDAQATALRLATEKAAERQHELHVEAARGRRTVAENRLLDDLRVVLRSAIDGGLGALVVATLDGRAITAADLAAALGYVGQVDDVELVEIAESNAAVSQLDELQRLFSQRHASREEGETARRELAIVATKMTGQDDLRDRARLAREKLDEASAEVRALQGQIGAQSRSGLGGIDVTDAEARVAELLGRHDVDAAQLASAVADAQAELFELASVKGELTTRIDEYSSRSVERRIQREHIQRRARSDSEYEWLGHLAGDQGSEQGPVDWTDATWQRLVNHVAASRAALSNLVEYVEGMASAAQDQAGSGPLARALTAAIEESALEQLAARPIADSLFDGGEVQRVSLDDQSITWLTPAGEARTRPLAAFSSGEQAFGFMRARLQQVAAVPSLNRLVFLDEFGAFIAADRRRPLAELLTSAELLELAQQVVVVLPLQADYAAELEQTTGDLHDEFERRAAGVAEHGYFTEKFER